MKPLFGGFFRIAPFAQTDDDGRFFSHRTVGAMRWMVVFDMEETKTAACMARRCLQY